MMTRLTIVALSLFLFAAKSGAAPTTQNWIDSAPPGWLTITAKYPTTTISATTQPTTAPATQPTLITQASNHVAFEVQPNGNFYLADTHVSTGGIVRSQFGANSIYLENVWGDKQPSGGGVYGVILATKPVQSFVWDNTPRRKTNPNDDDFTNGGEAAIRIMGGCVHAQLINVNLRNRKHDFYDPTGILQGTPGVRQDYWKQCLQVRDVKLCEMIGGRVIGLIDVGQQKNTALTPQHVDELRFTGTKLTNLPTITDHKTVGKIVIKGCPKIDDKGNVIGAWKDQTL